jgi:hypothetical protein
VSPLLYGRFDCKTSPFGKLKEKKDNIKFFLMKVSVKQIFKTQKCKIMSRNGVTIDGVWIDNWIY